MISTVLIKYYEKIVILHRCRSEIYKCAQLSNVRPWVRIQLEFFFYEGIIRERTWDFLGTVGPRICLWLYFLITTVESLGLSPGLSPNLQISFENRIIYLEKWYFSERSIFKKKLDSSGKNVFALQYF